MNGSIRLARMAEQVESASKLIRPDKFIAWSHGDPAGLTQSLLNWSGQEIELARTPQEAELEK